MHSCFSAIIFHFGNRKLADSWVFRFTYVYTVDQDHVVKVRSFQPLERYNNYYVTQDLSNNTAIVYEGVQMMKDGITIKTDTIDMEQMREETELKEKKEKEKRRRRNGAGDKTYPQLLNIP